MSQSTENRANPSATAPTSVTVPADKISAISPSDRVPLPIRPGQEGILRETCVDNGEVWAGYATSTPGSANDWHHHGAHTVYVLPLTGEGSLEFVAPSGAAESVPLRLDGTVYVIPAGLVHRELNTGTVEHQVFMVRVGHGPGTISVEGPVAVRGAKPSQN